MTLTKRKPVRTTQNHRKRTGHHHTRNDHYMKAYWPYLPVFAVLGIGLLLNSMIGHSQHKVLGYSTSINAQVMLAETNGYRTSKHEAALQLNQQLTAAAQAKANDMAKRNYWSHVTPSGQQPWSFISAAGYQYEAAGENLAYGFASSDDVMTAWMRSPEHRANILNGNYQDVGFATADVADYQGTGPQTIVVAEYGEPMGMINANTALGSVHTAVLGTQTQQVSRLQLLTASSTVALVVAALAGGALGIFFIRHDRAWHKVLVKSEEFAIAHPFFDVFLMSVAVLAFLLSHAAGTIL